jgi:DNA-binding CsgD family transcriptional regulator
MKTHATGIPKVAIIDANALAVIGLKQLLESIMPVIAVDGYGSFAELEANRPDDYMHYFVSMDIVLSHRDFFRDRQRKTIVLSLSLATTSSLAGFHALCINQPEPLLIRQLLHLHQHGHSNGRNLPPLPQPVEQKVLSDREIEVMSLIAQGLINKEIAERLHIALSTVVTHRKNIMEKLGLKSVSALTIYAVMHGYVDINRI